MRPRLHLLHHPVGDPRDGVLGDLGVVDLGEVGGDVAGRQSARIQRRTISSMLDSRRCRLATITGSKPPSRSRGTSTSTCPESVDIALARFPLRELPGSGRPDHAGYSPKCSAISSFKVVSISVYVSAFNSPPARSRQHLGRP
jgi:hypothetical protein